jgi:hypothetical protein
MIDKYLDEAGVWAESCGTGVLAVTRLGGGERPACALDALIPGP